MRWIPPHPGIFLKKGQTFQRASPKSFTLVDSWQKPHFYIKLAKVSSVFFYPCISSNCPEKERQCWILVPLLYLERCLKSLIKPDPVAVGTGILQINPPRLLREAVGCQAAKQGQHLLNAPGSLICHLLLHWTQVVSRGFAGQYCSNVSSLGNDSYCGTGTLQATQKVGKNKFFPGEE